MDHFLNQLNNRFLFPRSVIENVNVILSSSNSTQYEEKIKQPVKIYQGHLDCSMLAVLSEIKIWQQKFTGTKNALIRTNNAVKKCNISIFPSTFKLL
jgi:hypothetical protein